MNESAICQRICRCGQNLLDGRCVTCRKGSLDCNCILEKPAGAVEVLIDDRKDGYEEVEIVKQRKNT